MIAELLAKLGLDSSGFKANMKSAEGSAKSFNSVIKSVGATLGIAFSVGAVISWGKEFVKWASEASRSAENLGITTAEMLSLSKSAQKAGLETGNMQKILSKLNSELENARNGSEESAKKFDNLGLSITELSSASASQKLKMIADAVFIKGKPLSAVSKIFGDEDGVRVISMFKDISENGLEPANQALGEQADKIREVSNDWKKLGTEIKEATLRAMVWAKETGENKGIKEMAFGQVVARKARQMGMFDDLDTNTEAGQKEAQRRYNRYKANVPYSLWAHGRKFKKEVEDEEKSIRDYIDKQDASKKALNAEIQAAIDAEDTSTAMTAEYEANVKKRTGESQALAKKKAIRDRARETEAAQSRLDKAAEQAKADELAAKKELEIQKAEAIDDSIRENLNRKKAKADDLKSQVDNENQRLLDIQKNTQGYSINRGDLASVGGRIGNMRPGYEGDTRQMKIAEDSRQSLATIATLTQQLLELQRATRGEVL